MHDTAHATRVSPVGVKGEPIRFAGVTKRFGTAAAVDDISLEVQAGEFLSLLGPSGSGKTTLLMMVAGFETPSSGAIHLSNRDLTHVPPNKRGVGMVFQRYALFPHMSVAENVAFPLKMRGVRKTDRIGGCRRPSGSCGSMDTARASPRSSPVASSSVSQSLARWSSSRR